MFPKYLHNLEQQTGQEKVHAKSETNYNKIYTPEREHIAKALIRAWQKEGHTIVLSGGVYDIPTRMHQEYANSLKTLGTKLVMMVSTDDRVISSKGKPTVVDWTNRAKVLAHNPSIDLIVPKDKGQTNLDFLQEYKPNRITYSTTSGVREFEELEQVILPQFDSYINYNGRLTIKIDDQECQIIVFHHNMIEERAKVGETILGFLDRCKQTSVEYNTKKWEDPENVSGSLIKKRIINQYLESQK